MRTGSSSPTSTAPRSAGSTGRQLSGDGDLREAGDPVEEQLESGDTLFRALEVMVQSAAAQCCVVDDNKRFTGVVDMTHLSKAIRRAQTEARRHYEDLEANA